MKLLVAKVFVTNQRKSKRRDSTGGKHLVWMVLYIFIRMIKEWIFQEFYL